MESVGGVESLLDWGDIPQELKITERALSNRALGELAEVMVVAGMAAWNWVFSMGLPMQDGRFLPESPLGGDSQDWA